MKNAHDAQRTTIEMSKVIMKEKDSLNACKNIVPKVRAKCNKVKNEITEDNIIIDEEDDDNSNEYQTNIVKNTERKEKNYEPCAELSARRK